MKIIMTITDNPATGKATVEIQFDPPLQRGAPETPAVHAMKIALEAIRTGAKRIGSEHYTFTKP